MRKQNLNAVTYPCAAAAGIVARRAIVFDGTNRGNVKMPAGTPEAAFAGVSLDAQQGNEVGLQTHGIAVVESDGSAVINPGDQIVIVGTTGRVKAQAIAAGSANVYSVIGTCVAPAQIAATAGLYVEVLLHPYRVVAA